jgi:hypothetical protein
VPNLSRKCQQEPQIVTWNRRVKNLIRYYRTNRKKTTMRMTIRRRKMMMKMIAMNWMRMVRNNNNKRTKAWYRCLKILKRI